MPRRVLTIADLTGGLNVSLPPENIRDEEAVELLNCKIFEGRISKEWGFSKFCAHTFPETVTFIDQFFDTQGGSEFFVFTSNHIYKMGTDRESWTEVTPSGGITGATIKDRWNSVQFPYTDSGGTFHDAYICTNFVSGVLKWEPGATAFTVLPGTENKKAVALAVYYNHLFLGRVEEDSKLLPQRLRWSDTGNPEVWDSGNAGYVDLIETADWVVGFSMLRGTLYVFKERSIWRVHYRGTPNRLFDFEIVIDGIGARSPDAIVSLGDRIIFLSWDNIYEFDGVRVLPIGDPVQPALFGSQSQLNEDYTDAFWAIFLEERSQYWAFFVEGQSNQHPTICYRYDTALRAWDKIDISFTGGGYYTEEGGERSWASLDPLFTWNDIDFPWFSQNLEGGRPLTLFGTATGEIYYLDALNLSDLEGKWRSKNFVFDVPQRIMSVRFLVQGTVTFRFSLDGGTTWTRTKQFSGGATPNWIRIPINRVSSSLMLEGRIPPKKTGAIVRLEIETEPRGRLSHVR